MLSEINCVGSDEGVTGSRGINYRNPSSFYGSAKVLAAGDVEDSLTTVVSYAC